MAGQLLVEWGHRVVLHARNRQRADDARRALPQAASVVIGDFSRLTEARNVAEQVNKLGQFDAVIHNAAVGDKERRGIETEDGLPHVFAINVLAPYVLTALIEKPTRLVYLSSGLHRSAKANLDDLTWQSRRWNGSEAYSESKLHDVLLAFFVARRWPDTYSNAVDPGWVPTRMGGPGAPDDLKEGYSTQAWLAVSEDAAARVTGEYFHHMRPRKPNPQAYDITLQDRLIDTCEKLSKVSFPG